jgi:hypothetical protein
MTGTMASAPIPSVLLMSAGRALYGLALLTVPGTMLAAVTGEAPSRRDRAVTRVLGARHVTQAIVSAAVVLTEEKLAAKGPSVPASSVLASGAVVDSLHAASMVGFAVRRSTPQRAELTDAAVATLLAVLGVALSKSGPSAGTSPPAAAV